ncbi:MAG TPA: hypothetical protein VMO17_09660 [Terriglobia bacterium]|nr:hypothetical protein [Terriglobia bacterium]
MQHLTQDELVLYYYREKGVVDLRQAEEHLQSCDHCRQDLAGLTDMLAAMDSLPTPERDASYGAEVWTRIRPRLGETPQKRRSFIFPIRIWALAGGLAVLLVAAFWGGRLWQQHQTPPVAAISVPARERILMVAVGDHLDRAQVLLVEVMNQESAGPINITQTKQLAQELVESNRLYRQTALHSGDPGRANVLDGLERVLLQLAHSPDQISAEELESLQHQIGAQGILFKVRVEALEVAQKQRGAPRRGSGTTL